MRRCRTLWLGSLLLISMMIVLNPTAVLAAEGGDPPPEDLVMTGDIEIQSLTGSFIEAVPLNDCYQSNGAATVCFRIHNASPDGEWIERVRLTFPEFWISDCVYQGARDSSGAIVNMSCSGDGTREVIYEDNDGDLWGEITNGATWDVCVNVTANSPNVGGVRQVPWVLQSRAGSALNDSLPLDECTPIRLLPNRLEVEGCNGLEQTHALAMVNHTGGTDDFELTYEVADDQAEFLDQQTGPFSLNDGGIVTFTVKLKPRLCLEPGEQFTATVSVRGHNSEEEDRMDIVHTVTDFSGWESRAATPSQGLDNVVIWAREQDQGLWSIGGYGSGGATQRYDSGTGTWTSYAPQTTLSPTIEYPMDGCYGLNDVGDEIVVLFPDTMVTNTLQIFNITDRSWYTEAVPDFYPPEGRWAQDVVSLLEIPEEFMHVPAGERNACYLSGGATQPGGGETRNLWFYDPASNSGNELGQFFSGNEPQYLPQVWFNFHASWYVPWIGTGGGICVAGGLDHNSQLSKHTQCYDLASGTFNAVDDDLNQLPVYWWGMADGWAVRDGRYQLWMANGVGGDSFNFYPRSLYFEEGDTVFQYGPDVPEPLYRLEGTGFDGRFVTVQGSNGGFVGTDRHFWLSACPTCHQIYLPLVLRQ